MVVTANAIYVRYDGGHVYVDRSGSSRKRELFLSLTNVSDRDRAAGIGARYLAANNSERTTYADAGFIRSSDQLPSELRPGDAISGEIIQSVSSTMVGDGDVQVAVETADAASDVVRSIERQIDRLGRGVPSEYARPDWKRQEQGGGTSTTPPGFTQSGELTPSFSTAWRAPRPFHCSFLEATLDLPGTTYTEAWIIRGVGSGPPPEVLASEGWERVARVIIPAGETMGIAVVNRGFAVGESVVMVLHRAGTGAQGLQVAVRGATP